MNSIARVGKLLRIELEVKGKLILIICAAAVALTLYLKFVESNPNPYGGNQDPLSFIRPYGTIQKFHFNWFPTFLYVVGLAITSLMFYEYRGGKSRNYHLTIPASSSEKWWCKLIAYVLISNLVILVGYQVIGIAINRVEAADGWIYAKLGLFDPYLWKVFKGYLFVQALFVVGATFTQRFTLVKVGLLLFILKYACSWVTKITLPLIIEDTDKASFSGFSPSGLSGVLQRGGLNYNGPESILTAFSPTGLSWLIILIIVIGLYAFSYLRFKELES